MSHLELFELLDLYSVVRLFDGCVLTPGHLSWGLSSLYKLTVILLWWMREYLYLAQLEERPVYLFIIYNIIVRLRLYILPSSIEVYIDSLSPLVCTHWKSYIVLIVDSSSSTYSGNSKLWCLDNHNYYKFMLQFNIISYFIDFYIIN